MDVVEAIIADDEIFASGWDGFGLAIQAYQKRAVPLCDWVVEAARRHGRKLMVRLVKGAYWDTEIKFAQVSGLTDYPVFTRKVATDVSYLACARQLLDAGDVIYPAFATHNANTIAQVKAIAGDRPFEFQRLHGMGEELYAELRKLEEGIGEPPTPVRIYAPVGSHKELLAYLVRRLLENGANSSFVNRIADAEVSLDELVRDPVAELAALEPKRNPSIPLPRDIFGAGAAQQRGRRPQRSAGARAAARAAGRARSEKLERRAGHRQGQGARRHLALRPLGRRRRGQGGERQGRRRDGSRRRRGPGRMGHGRRGRAGGAARPRRRPVRGAFGRLLLAVHPRGREDAGRRGARSARGGRFPALLRVRGAAPVQRADARCPGRPASGTSCASTAAGCSPPFRRGISRWRSSPAWCRRRSPRAMR